MVCIYETHRFLCHRIKSLRISRPLLQRIWKMMILISRSISKKSDFLQCTPKSQPHRGTSVVELKTFISTARGEIFQDDIITPCCHIPLTVNSEEMMPTKATNGYSPFGKGNTTYIICFYFVKIFTKKWRNFMFFVYPISKFHSEILT